jgi:hypothetical protein
MLMGLKQIAKEKTVVSTPGKFSVASPALHMALAFLVAMLMGLSMHVRAVGRRSMVLEARIVIRVVVCRGPGVVFRSLVLSKISSE